MSSNQELKEVFEQYAKSLNLQNISKNGLKSVEETIEGILTRLDEFGEHLDYINNNTSNISGKVVPQLFVMAVTLELLFKKIDCIQEYVSHVNTKVNQLEKKIVEIEKQRSSTLSKFIPSFFKKSQPTTKPTPILFHAQEYYTDPSILEKNIQKVIEDHTKERIVFHESKSETTSPVPKEEELIEEKEVIQTPQITEEVKQEEKQEEPKDVSKNTPQFAEEEGEVVEGEEVEGEEVEGEEAEGEDDEEDDD